jgi:hypothetical protein
MKNIFLKFIFFNLFFSQIFTFLTKNEILFSSILINIIVLQMAIRYVFLKNEITLKGKVEIRYKEEKNWWDKFKKNTKKTFYLCSAVGLGYFISSFKQKNLFMLNKV